MNEKQVAMKQAALKYLEHGFSIIPIANNQKAPPKGFGWKPYQSRLATPSEVDAWFARWPNMNLGLVTGTISGVVVVDFDHGTTPEGFPPTVTARTAHGGWHLFYKQPKYEVKTMAGYKEHIDIRGEGGMVVVAPSQLSKSERYTWEIDLFENDCEPFPNLSGVERGKTTQSTAGIEGGDLIPVGQRNNAAAVFAGRLLSRMNPVDMDEAWSRMQHWNDTSLAEPLAASELRTVFDSIAKSELAKRANVKGSEESGPLNLTPITLADLYAMPDVEIKMFVQDLIPFGSIVAFTGDSSSFKTFLLQSLAGHALTGTPWLGHFETAKGKVLIVDEENPLPFTRERFGLMGTPASNELVLLVQSGFMLDAKGHLETLKSYVDVMQPSLIIFDSLVDIHQKEENSSEMNSLFKSIRAELLTPDRVIIVIHHHRKVQVGQSRKASSNIRGSTAIRGAVDVHIAADRVGTGQEVILTHDKMRGGKEVEPFRVKLQLQEDHTLNFDYQGEDHSARETLEAAQRSVLDFLANATEEVDVKTFASQLLMSGGSVRAVMETLVESGKVVERVGARGKKLYSLPLVEEESEETTENNSTDQLF